MSEQTTVEHDHTPAEAEDRFGNESNGAEGRDGDASRDGVSEDERQVPVSEAIRYRKRAQAAEQRLRDLESKFDEAQRALDQTREQLDAIERRRRIDQSLIESEAIDLEAARLLTEAAVEQMDEADVDAAVTELKRRKPYLFRRSVGTGGGMSPKPRRNGSSVDDAAETAAVSGNRRDLLRYLRLRRGVR